MTLRQRERSSVNQKKMDDIKSEFLDLGVDEGEYYKTIAQLLGLGLDQ